MLRQGCYRRGSLVGDAVGGGTLRMWILLLEPIARVEYVLGLDAHICKTKYSSKWYLPQILIFL